MIVDRMCYISEQYDYLGLACDFVLCAVMLNSDYANIQDKTLA